MATLASLRERIEMLQQEAELLRKSELSGVIARIRAEVAEYDLSPEDIFGGKGKRGPRGNKAAAKGAGARTPRPAKYRDPKTGKTWNGVGKPPVWIAGSRNRDKFLIDASDASAEEGASATASSAPEKKARKAAVSRSRPRKPAAKKVSKRGVAKKVAEESTAAAESGNGGVSA